MPNRATTAITTTRSWLVWLPVLMVASLLYWTVALGLGGMSLMAVSALSGNDGAGGIGMSGGDTDTAAASARDGYEPIIVHLEESVEPEDVDDNPGCGLASGASGSEDVEEVAPRDMRASSATDFSSGAALR
jgi:hypothetical protein